MNENYEKIMAEYRDADFNKRLNMYLQLPRLRSEFILIDQHDLKTNLTVGLKLRKPSILAQLSDVFNAIALGAKKLFGNASV